VTAQRRTTVMRGLHATDAMRLDILHGIAPMMMSEIMKAAVTTELISY